MVRSKWSRIRGVLGVMLASVVLLCGCVDQRGPSSRQESAQRSEASGESGQASPRLIAASPAIVDMMDRLDLPLIAVCKTSSELPQRYRELPRIGMPMNPDIEMIRSLNPDQVFSPDSLENDLRKKYEAAKVGYTFLNLRSVEGLYDAIAELGRRYGRTDRAETLISEHQAFMEAFRTRNAQKRKPKVLILMGLPGAYIIATAHSYIGNLVKLAGGENVYTDDQKAFLTPNTEDIKSKEPDIILRAAHAMPDDVKAMFAKEFKENQIWRHFDAVRAGRVYDLDPDRFNMSARFNYREALTDLEKLFYGALSQR